MDKVIKSTVFALFYFAGAIQDRFQTVNNSYAAKESSTFTFFRYLFPDGLGKTNKALTCTHNYTAVFTVLSNDLEHFRGEVFGLIRTKPVLHLIHHDYNAVNSILIVDELAPIFQSAILPGIIEVVYLLGLRILFLPLHGLFHHCNCLAGALAACKDYTALMPEKLGIPREEVRAKTLRESVKKRIEKAFTLYIIVLAFGYFLTSFKVNKKICENN